MGIMGTPTAQHERGKSIMANPFDAPGDRISRRSLHLDRFNPVEMLLSDFRLDSQSCGLGFASERIDALASSVPRFGWNDPLITLYIRWTLGDLSGSASAKLDVMRRVFGSDNVVLGGYYQAGTLCLPEGVPEFTSDMLEWGVIDLGANRKKAPNQIDPAKAAGLEVFDVSGQHPKHTLSHNGEDIPYLDVPGLQVAVPGESFPSAPSVNGHGNGRVSICAGPADFACSEYAGPVLVVES